MTNAPTPPRPDFEAWCDALHEVAVKREYALPAGMSFTEMTGPECWRDAYDAGCSPEHALDEDESYAD